MNVHEFERKLWLADQTINDRGFKADIALAKAAKRACEREKKQLDKRVHEISLGGIDSATQREKIKQLLKGFGVDLPDMQAATVDAYLDSTEISGMAQELIDARQRVSKSSTAKYGRILDAIGPDGRLRGALQYCGAQRTGRWAGRIFQPHNLPRPKTPAEEINAAVKALKLGLGDLITDNLHQLCSDTLRSLIVAPKGKKLTVADWNAIEGRIVAWLAGEDWKLRVYEDPDRDVYVETYRTMFGVPESVDVTKDQRQQGKVFELFGGYEGGVGALCQWARAYGIDLRELGIGVWRIAPRPIKEKARDMTQFAQYRGDTPMAKQQPKLYTMLEAAKLLWRSTSPATCRLWKLYQQAALQAISNKGQKYKAGRCIFYWRSDYLIVRLPSGRSILYRDPRVIRDSDNGRPNILYRGPYGGMIPIYGGKFTENITQAVARDVLGVAILRLEDEGYPIVMHVHDEVIEENERRAPRSLERTCEIMCDDIDWAPGLPLRAEGYEALRYRKD